MGKRLVQAIGAFDLPATIPCPPGKLKPERHSGWDKHCSDYIPEQPVVSGDIPAHTVHSVKGETHDVTVLVCPDPLKEDECPSDAWWSPADQDREEKRIAYVAMTRSQNELVVCVSEPCYKRLCAKRPEFVACFESMTVSEFVTAMQRLR